MRRLVPALLLAAVACGGARADVPDPPLPERILPAAIAGFEVRAEPSAEQAFRTSNDVSLVADGAVYTLRRNGAVEASLQVSVLKGEYSFEDDEVRRGVRASIELGRYRWFKIAGQWVGEQRLPEIGLYLWMPDDQTYEVLVVRPNLGIPVDLLRAIITYQRGDA